LRVLKPKPAKLFRITTAFAALHPSSQRPSPVEAPAITHLRDVLGDTAYESLAYKDEAMTTAEVVTYAYDQIDQVRAELNGVSK
jgi:hypothetical protein